MIPSAHYDREYERRTFCELPGILHKVERVHLRLKWKFTIPVEKAQPEKDVFLGDQPCGNKDAGEKVKAVTLVML